MGERSEHRRLWWSLRALGVASAGALIAGGVVRAQAAEAGRAAAGEAAVSSAKATSYVPVVVPTSGPGIASPVRGQANVYVGRAITENLAGKAATAISFPEVDIVIYALDDFSPEGYQNSPAWVISNPKTSTDQPNPTAVSYGQLPAVSISTLAFGAIPLKATVHLSQVVDPSTGFYEPLFAQQKNAVPAGSGYGFTLSGKLAVSISDATVDGVPLEISPRCRTVTPAHLVAYANGTVGDFDYYNPFYGGRFSGNVVVPGFTGCTARPASGAAEHLDALLDGTVSGASNAVFISQGGLGFYDASGVNACYPGGFTLGCEAASPVPTIVGPTTAPPPVPPSDYPPPVE